MLQSAHCPVSQLRKVSIRPGSELARPHRAPGAEHRCFMVAAAARRPCRCEDQIQPAASTARSRAAIDQITTKNDPSWNRELASGLRERAHPCHPRSPVMKALRRNAIKKCALAGVASFIPPLRSPSVCSRASQLVGAGYYVSQSPSLRRPMDPASVFFFLLLPVSRGPVAGRRREWRKRHQLSLAGLCRRGGHGGGALELPPSSAALERADRSPPADP